MVHLPSIRSLQAFLAVLSTGSTVKAARSLNMTQSTVSKQITALEIALNTGFFIRTPGGLALPRPPRCMSLMPHRGGHLA